MAEIDTATICPCLLISATLGQEGYKYSTSGLYYAPTAENIEEFVTYIKGGLEQLAWAGSNHVGMVQTVINP